MLVERYTPRVNRLTAQLIADLEDARDAAQESLVKLCTKLRQFRGDAQFATWLHRLVVNTCRDFQERAACPPDRSAAADRGGDRRGVRSVPRPGARRPAPRARDRALPALRIDQRDVVVLRDVLGFSYEDIGRRREDAGRNGEVLRAPRPGTPARLRRGAAPRGGDRGSLGGQRVVTGPLGRAEIEAIIPHRDPFLLLDEVTEIIPGKRVVARKLVREDEWYLAGHFPGRPIMPGVLMVEAMAQAGAVAVLSEPSNAGKLALFAGINDVRFKRLVTPGDELELVCELDRLRGPIGRGAATRDGGRRAGREGHAHSSRSRIPTHDLEGRSVDPPRRDHRPRRLRARQGR